MVVFNNSSSNLVEEGDSTRGSLFMRCIKPFEVLIGVERFQMLTYLLTVKNLSEAADDSLSYSETGHPDWSYGARKAIGVDVDTSSTHRMQSRLWRDVGSGSATTLSTLRLL